jgi:hypothetical protein
MYTQKPIETFLPVVAEDKSYSADPVVPPLFSLYEIPNPDEGGAYVAPQATMFVSSGFCAAVKNCICVEAFPASDHDPPALLQTVELVKSVVFIAWPLVLESKFTYTFGVCAAIGSAISRARSKIDLFIRI